MDDAPYSGRFTELLMEGLGHYRRGALEQAMASWEGAYHVEAGNPQAREFLRTALLRLQVKLGRDDGRAHPWLSDLEPQTPPSSPRAADAEHAFTPPPLPAPLRDGTPIGAMRPTPLVVARLVTPLGTKRIPTPAATPRLTQEGSAAQVLAQEPDDDGAREIEAGCERGLTALYEAALGGLHGQPRLLLSSQGMLELALDSSTGFVLAQIDGNLTYEELFDICGLPRAEAAKILAGLVKDGVIGSEPLGERGGGGPGSDGPA